MIEVQSNRNVTSFMFLRSNILIISSMESDNSVSRVKKRLYNIK
jgi:hypothetical protein